MKLELAGNAAPVPSLDAVAEVVWHDDEGNLCAWAQTIDGERWMHIPAIASYRLRPKEETVLAVPDPSASAALVTSGYLSSVLPMLVQLGGREVLHASSVLAETGAVGFCAVSMTGKSSIAYELSRRGYELFGDDALALDTTTTPIEVVRLPFELQLRPPYDRAEARGAKLTGGGDRDSVPLAAVCTLTRSHSPTESARVRRLSPTEAFRVLLIHAYSFSLDDVERNRKLVIQYMELAANVPVFDVVFRPGFEYVSEVLDTIERVVGLRPPRR